jgi:hypothetical protein
LALPVENKIGGVPKQKDRRMNPAAFSIGQK